MHPILFLAVQFLSMGAIIQGGGVSQLPPFSVKGNACMATSLVSTVLGIELEAEEIIAGMKVKAAACIEQAKADSEAAVAASNNVLAAEVKKLEAVAASERAAKERELTAVGEASLALVNNISDAARNNAVKLLVKSLTGK